MSIFLADADRNVRSAMRLALEQAADHRVVGEAADAASLLDGIAVATPRLAIVDWMLPGLPPGDPFAPLFDHLPTLLVLVISLRPGDADACREAGANGFVCKLEPPERLLAVVEGLLRGG